MYIVALLVYAFIVAPTIGSILFYTAVGQPEKILNSIWIIRLLKKISKNWYTVEDITFEVPNDISWGVITHIEPIWDGKVHIDKATFAPGIWAGTEGLNVDIKLPSLPTVTHTVLKVDLNRGIVVFADYLHPSYEGAEIYSSPHQWIDSTR